MILKSIHVTIPDTKPFDRGDWFEAFVGHFVLPVIATNLVESYWFTRYQDPKKHARFRLRLKNYVQLKPTVDALIGKWGFKDLADEENYGEEFRSQRRVGDRTPPADPAKRQELIWRFLTSAAALYVDTFSHADNDGYWHREENRDQVNNIDGDTMESIHHLFCNLTAIQPRVEILEQSNSQGFRSTVLIAGTYRRWMGIPDTAVRTSQRVNF